MTTLGWRKPIPEKRICTLCGVERPLNMFLTRSNGRPDSRCRAPQCMKEKRERIYASRNSRASDPEFKAKVREWDRRKHLRSKRSRLTHAKVKRALASGKLTKLPCEVCQSDRSVAHHDDYAKPLDVRWLCKLHHAEWHVKNGRGKNHDQDV